MPPPVVLASLATTTGDIPEAGDELSVTPAEDAADEAEFTVASREFAVDVESSRTAEHIPLPMPAPKRPPPPPTPAQRLKLDAKGRAKAEKCLAEAVYFEARGESLRGQLAVAQVVMNRVFSPFYPNDVCGVVYQNAHRHLSCQFTFACDGIPERVTEMGPWTRAKRIAKATLDGKVWVQEVAKSTHYHAVYVHPNWVREMKKMARHGVHAFYRPRRWGDGSRETTWSNIVHIAARAAIVD
jgi:spore germination cell wall hydrolase CwlJ-like protein